MRLHGCDGHLWREEGCGKWEQLRAGGEEGSPSPSLRPQAAPHPGCDGLTDAAGRTPVCWTPAVSAPRRPRLHPCSFLPVPARSCLLGCFWGGEGVGADPTVLRRAGTITPSRMSPACQRGNSLQPQIHLKRNKKM